MYNISVINVFFFFKSHKKKKHAQTTVVNKSKTLQNILLLENHTYAQLFFNPLQNI